MRQGIAEQEKAVQFLYNTLERSRAGIDELDQDLYLDNEEDLHDCLIAVLQALRDRLPVNEAIRLGAQLPIIIRGYYYEGWRPGFGPEKYRDAKSFIDNVAESVGKERLTQDASYVAKGILKFLEKKMPNEINDVKSNMPKEIAEWWARPERKQSQSEGEVPVWHQPESATRD
jgi:uncharacterized protein (DUF2267 family)